MQSTFYFILFFVWYNLFLVLNVTSISFFLRKDTISSIHPPSYVSVLYEFFVLITWGKTSLIARSYNCFRSSRWTFSILYRIFTAICWVMFYSFANFFLVWLIETNRWITLLNVATLGWYGCTKLLCCICMGWIANNKKIYLPFNLFIGES